MILLWSIKKVLCKKIKDLQGIICFFFCSITHWFSHSNYILMLLKRASAMNCNNPVIPIID